MVFIIWASALTLSSALASWQADDRVEHRQSGEDGRGGDVAGDEQADHGRCQQDELHDVAVLAQEGLETRLLLGLGKPVRALGLEPPAYLLDSQATPWLDAELPGDRGHVGAMPTSASGWLTLRLLAHGHGLRSTQPRWASPD
jgi:hypothetical protein